MARYSFSDATKITTAANNDFSAAVTCPDPKTGAVLFCFIAYNAAAATITAARIGANVNDGGVPLELLVTVNSNPTLHVFMCRNPPGGSQTITIDWATPPTANQTGYADFIFGLDLGNPCGAADTATGNSASASVTGHTADAEILLDFVESIAGTTPIATAGQTVLGSQNADLGTAFGFKQIAGPTQAMTYTVASGPWSMACVALNEAKSAGRPTLA